VREDVPPLTTAVSAAEAAAEIRASRRRVVVDGLGIAVSAAGFGFVYGLAARTDAHFSPLEAMAMSLFAFAGAAQFAAVGYVASGLAWPVIALLTALLNTRHVLYSAALAPWFRGRSFAERAVAAHLLTDEAFALSIAHFRRLGRYDAFGYWYAAIVTTLIPWNVATFAGDPRRRDRRSEPPRDRRHLPGGDDRARRRTDQWPTGARRCDRGGVRRSRRLADGRPDDRDHRRRRDRTGRRPPRTGVTCR
jgi:hypothetical protein